MTRLPCCFASYPPGQNIARNPANIPRVTRSHPLQHARAPRPQRRPKHRKTGPGTPVLPDIPQAKNKAETTDSSREADDPPPLLFFLIPDRAEYRPRSRKHPPRHPEPPFSTPRAPRPQRRPKHRKTGPGTPVPPDPPGRTPSALLAPPGAARCRGVPASFKKCPPAKNFMKKNLFEKLPSQAASRYPPAQADPRRYEAETAR